MGAVHLVGRDQKSRHRKTDTRVGQRRHMGRFRGVGRLHGGRLPIRRQRHRVPTGSIGRVRRLRACRHGRGGPRGRVDPDQRVQRAWPRRRIHTRNQRLPTGRSRKWRPLHPLKGKPSMEPKRNRIIAATGFAVALLILGGNVAVICAGNGTAEDTQSTVARPRTKTEPGQKTAGDEETEPATRRRTIRAPTSRRKRSASTWAANEANSKANTSRRCRRPRHTGIIHSPAAIARDRVHRLPRVHGAAGGDMRRIHRAGGILGA